MNLIFSRCALQKLTIIIVMLGLFHNKNLATSTDGVKVVVIDAGHGGKDPGAVGKKAMEKDIVLAIALKTGKYITENFPDVKVIYTRTEDVFVPLHERSDKANKNHADLFISIHANADPKYQAIGTETFAMGVDKSESNLEVAKLENSVILFEDDHTTRYEGFDPNSVESYILFGMIQNIYLKQSLEFANLIQWQIREKARRVDRGVKQARFLVLWRTTMPSVLVEVGYITHPDEEAYLVSNDGQDYLASAIYRAFRDYKSLIETNNRDGYTSSLQVNSPSNLNSDTSTAPVILKETDINIYFKVQIAAASKQIPLKPMYFQGLENVEEYLHNNIYKYVVGENIITYDKAKDFSNEIKAYYPDAFIVAVQKGEIIPLKKALKLN